MPTPFIYTGAANELHQALDVNNVTKLVPEMDAEFRYIADFKAEAYKNRKITSASRKGSYANMGGGGKLIAKVPGRLLRAALWLNPSLLQDEKAWDEFLRALPPICDYRKTPV